MRKIIFGLFVVFLGLFANAQDAEVYVVTGKVIDAETLKPVPMAFLLNTAKMYGAQTDTSGKFRILMMKSDTVRVSSIGYYTLYWAPDFSKAAGKYIRTVIYLKPQTYAIDAVSIFDARWNSFVYDAANVDIDEDENQKRIMKWISKLVEAEDLENQNLQSGIQIPLPIYTHREKMLQKIQEQRRIDELNKLAYDKFNQDFVSRITGLTGNDLTDFMRYCSFDRDFILRTSEYELIVIVQDIYEEYKLKN